MVAEKINSLKQSLNSPSKLFEHRDASNQLRQAWSVWQKQIKAALEKTRYDYLDALSSFKNLKNSVGTIRQAIEEEDRTNNNRPTKTTSHLRNVLFNQLLWVKDIVNGLDAINALNQSVDETFENDLDQNDEYSSATNRKFSTGTFAARSYSDFFVGSYKGHERNIRFQRVLENKPNSAPATPAR